MIDISRIITEEIDAADLVLKDGEVNFKSFEIKDTLNPDIFEGDVLKPEISESLRTVYDSILDNLEAYVRESLSDVILVGSIVSYHYSSYSDIDLHFVVDMKKIGDKSLVREMLDAKRKLWNMQHNVEVAGYEVEIYFQDIDEVIESNGIYSLLDGKWIKHPDKENYVLEKDIIQRKVLDIIREIDDMCEDDTLDSGLLEDVWDRVVKSRKEFLENEGEFSEGNIIFKILRRSGHIEKLSNRIQELKDKSLSKDKNNETAMIEISEEKYKELLTEAAKNYSKRRSLKVYEGLEEDELKRRIAEDIAADLDECGLKEDNTSECGNQQELSKNFHKPAAKENVNEEDEWDALYNQIGRSQRAGGESAAKRLLEDIYNAKRVILKGKTQKDIYMIKSEPAVNKQSTDELDLDGEGVAKVEIGTEREKAYPLNSIHLTIAKGAEAEEADLLIALYGKNGEEHYGKLKLDELDIVPIKKETYTEYRIIPKRAGE